ncbi:MAG: OmpA family protein [Alphaproteobacteria bacterium]|nr:OmpA family protein [Alphaproteobacteria bacterium]
MSKLRMLLTLSAAAMMAAAVDARSLPEQPADAPNPPKSTLVTPKHPGFKALLANDLEDARAYLTEAAERQPNDAFAELNLGAVYQRLGRMDLAEPLFREAMTHGRGLMPVAWTNEPQRGMTVEQVACDNLKNGLPPAPADQARPCQTTLTVAVQGTQQVQPTEFNTYFDFDQATLTAEGQQLIAEAARQALANPSARVSLIGHASRTGSLGYNQRLSERRVETVRQALIAAGVEAARIDAQALGETQLPVPTADGVEEPRNRVVKGTFSTGSSTVAEAIPASAPTGASGAALRR